MFGRGCVKQIEIGCRFLSSSHAELTQIWQERLEQCRQGGGERALKRHVIKNKKLPVREMLSQLLDSESHFLELGRQAGLDLRYGDVPCAGFVGGVGVIGGVLTMVTASDATVKGGTVYPITMKKQLRLQDIAAKFNLPSVYLVDSGGAYLPEQAAIFIEGGQSFYKQAVMSAKGLPQISLVCGSCTAGAAYSAVMPSHCVIMKDIGSLYLAGPPLVKAATGEDVTVEELGGADLHCRESGSTDYYVEGYEEAISTVRNVVHLHSDIFPVPRRWNEKPEGSNRDCSFATDINDVVESLVDEDSILKFKELYGEGIQCFFAKIDGLKVGVLAGQGEIDGKGALKGSHFAQLCEQAGISMLFIQGDVRAAYTRELASLMRSAAILTVPKITLVTGNTAGHAYFALNGGGMQPDLCYHWPTASISSNDDVTQDVISSANHWDAWESSANCLCDDVILPHETRDVIRLSLLAADTFRDAKLKTGKNSVLKF